MGHFRFRTVGRHSGRHGSLRVSRDEKREGGKVLVMESHICFNELCLSSDGYSWHFRVSMSAVGGRD